MVMNIRDALPNPQEARAALAEAADRAGRVRKADRLFGRILLIVAAMYLGAGIVLGLSDLGGRTLAGRGVVLILVGGLAVTLVLIWRIRAYSRSGPLRFALSCGAFGIWNAAVVGVSMATGWWGFHQPLAHFTVSAVVAATPLVVAAWLIGRRR